MEWDRLHYRLGNSCWETLSRSAVSQLHQMADSGVLSEGGRGYQARIKTLLYVCDERQLLWSSARDITGNTETIVTYLHIGRQHRKSLGVLQTFDSHSRHPEYFGQHDWPTRVLHLRTTIRPSAVVLIQLSISHAKAINHDTRPDMDTANLGTMPRRRSWFKSKLNQLRRTRHKTEKLPRFMVLPVYDNRWWPACAGSVSPASVRRSLPWLPYRRTQRRLLCSRYICALNMATLCPVQHYRHASRNSCEWCDWCKQVNAHLWWLQCRKYSP